MEFKRRIVVLLDKGLLWTRRWLMPKEENDFDLVSHREIMLIEMSTTLQSLRRKAEHLRNECCEANVHYFVMLGEITLGTDDGQVVVFRTPNSLMLRDLLRDAFSVLNKAQVGKRRVEE